MQDPAANSRGLDSPEKKASQPRYLELQDFQDTITDTPTFFLLPDGSGHAASYINVRIPLNIRVIALNSPLLSNSTINLHSIQATAHLMALEILKIQQDGEYILGRWSIGGAFAYEVAHILTLSGKTIQGVVLIDPCPLNAQPMSSTILELLQRIGLFDNIDRKNAAMRHVVFEHFEACRKTLKTHKPSVEHARMKDIKFAAIWAQNGVLERFSAENHIGAYINHEELNVRDEWLLLRRERSISHGDGRSY